MDRSWSGAWIALALAVLPGISCTSGSRCDAAHPCNAGDSCIDSTCGRQYATPLCIGVYCTLACTRGRETGEQNAGDCPEGFTECGQANHGETFMCKTNGIQPWQQSCTTDDDCADAVLVVSE